MNLDIHIETFQKEIETAIRVFYAYKTMSTLLTEQQYVDLMNKNVYFWKIFLSSVQTKLFIALGRLYNDSNIAFSFHSFIKTCRDNIYEFGRVSLERRKLESASSSTRPDWLDNFLKDAYFANTEDIDALSRSARPYNNKMKGVYKEIRSKVFAHAIHTDNVITSVIFQGGNFDEVESALTTLWSIYRHIWELYYNGQKESFAINNYPYMDEVSNCVRRAILCEV